MDKKGSVITKTFDIDGNIIKEGAVLSDKTILDQVDKILKRITYTVIGGEIIKKVNNLREAQEGDEANQKNGLFYFTHNKNTGLTSEDEIKIAKLRDGRHRSSGVFKVIDSKEDEAIEREKERNSKWYSIFNRSKNYNEHEEPRTTPSYPVDLTRVITVDKIIPAVLINEVKSDIPSKTVRAQIEEDVYGSHGRKILIPKGSKVLGEFKTIEDRAARRMYIAWYRIITPDGINIKLESELTDAQGSSGIEGEIDNRFKDRYGMAFLLSSMNALSQLTVPVNDLRYRGASDTFTREFSSVTGQLIREGLKVMPSITIPQGSRINISPLQDIWFRESDDKKIIVEGYENDK